ncbi:MAG: hypothetical protein M3N95_12305 [Actinomycetota bacterium]|nr:hypothetical protein [Actinomycetota bacterium]
MAQVDPEDDSIVRYVVLRYAFDPERGERRQQVTAAFDNEAEYRDHVVRLAAELRARDDHDPREHISGVVWEAGHGRKLANARLIKSAVQRGVSLPDDVWERAASDLPQGFAVSRAEFQGNLTPEV